MPFFWTPEKTLHDRAKKDRVPYDVWAREAMLNTPRASVDYYVVARDIAAILGDYAVDAIAFDCWRIEIFRKAALNIGLTLPLKEFGQGFKDMAPAIDRLESLLLNGQLCHGMHPVLTMCAANAVINKDAAGNRRLDKAAATRCIDGMVALAMAVGALNGEMAASGGDFEDFLSRPLSM